MASARQQWIDETTVQLKQHTDRSIIDPEIKVLEEKELEVVVLLHNWTQTTYTLL